MSESATPSLSTAQTLNFQAEVKQLLHLMIHSLYSNREIFLRELVSNASDALDKLRFEALTNRELDSAASGLEIRLEPDEKAHVLKVSDNGIGMSRAEVQAIVRPKTGKWAHLMRDLDDNVNLTINNSMVLMIRDGRLVDKQWIGKEAASSRHAGRAGDSERSPRQRGG